MTSLVRSVSLAALALCATAGACTVYDSPAAQEQGGDAGDAGMLDEHEGGDAGTASGGSNAGKSGSSSGGEGGTVIAPGSSGANSAGAAMVGGNGGSSAGSSSEGGSAGSVSGASGQTGGGSSAGTAGVAGASGAGGGPNVATCSDEPLTDKSEWKATASHSSTDPMNPASCALDGASTRWSSGKAQSGNEWLEIDFGKTVRLRAVNLQQGSGTSQNDYPRGYALRLSATSKKMDAPVLASGVGVSGPSTNITLPSTAAGRYLLISQTGSSLAWWSVVELEASCYD